MFPCSKCSFMSGSLQFSFFTFWSKWREMKKSAVLSLPADFGNFVAKTDEKRKSKDEMNRTIIEHFQRTLPKFYYVNCAQMYSWLRVLQEFPIIKSTPHSKFCKLCTKVPTIKEPNIGLFQNTPVFSLLMCVVFFDMIF